MRRHQESALSHVADPAHQPWLPRRDTTVLLLSRSPQLQGEVGRVAAAAAVELVIGDELDQGVGAPGGIAAVLVDSAPDAATTGWRGPVIVVGFAAETGPMWRQAARLEADRVAVLPESAQWLADYFAGLHRPASSTGVLGVVGGCGGAGASTLALLVAAEAASRGTSTLLVDGDRWGGGLESLLAGQDMPGLRWPELLQVSGSINPGQLAAALPHVGPLALLSWESGAAQQDGAGQQQGAGQQAGAVDGAQGAGVDSPVRSGAVNEVMRAAQGAYGLVVVDLARTVESLHILGNHCNGLLVVTPGRARSVAAAVRLGAALPTVPTAAVVRGPMVEGIDARMVATAAGLPLVAEVPWLRRVDQVLAAQRIPDLLRGRRLRGSLASILDWMAGSEPEASQPRIRTRK